MLERGQELSARFVLARRLGAGGSGEVWLAHDRELGDRVALKVLLPELSRDESAISALMREAQHAAMLQHPNVLRVHGVFRGERHAWISMEYAPGGDLTALRGAHWRRVVAAVLPIASALAAAHGAGLIHRDVKASNVLLDERGTPRLSDFGNALLAGSLPAKQAGRGSAFSMSPQQAAGAAATAQDDVYAFGAMLYELLSGYPPHYATGAGHRGSAPAQLPKSVPAPLQSLVCEMLAGDVGARPRDLTSVAERLQQLVEHEQRAAGIEAANESTNVATNVSKTMNIEPPSIRPPAAAHGEPLRGEWRRAEGQGATPAELRRQGFRRGLGAAAVVLGLAAVGVVFFALPKWVDTPAQQTPARMEIAKPAAPVAEPAEREQVDFAALARAKQESDEIRAGLEERLQKLRERAAERWGGEEFSRAAQELAAGDERYQAREYIAAKEHFGAVAPLLATVEERATKALQSQLQAGAAAIESGRSADAQAAYELALKIEPGNKDATLGAKRAGTLDEVLALVSAAENLERDGNVGDARAQFAKALALDALMARASAGIARIDAKLAGDAFAANMARGYSSLAASDYASARSAFEAARKIRPGAPEIDTALNQIEQEQRTRSIAAKLEAARGFESQEKWADALREFRSVLELDSTVAAAQEGSARVGPRAALNEQLEQYLTQPERLFSQPVRAAAKETLARARSVRDAGPLLQRQIGTLEQWLQRADTPVQVALQSDNVTQVTIYRVGALGTFEQRSLELAPGSYTVVGTRPGYRDVRREIKVAPGAAIEPVVIRCEDRI